MLEPHATAHRFDVTLYDREPEASTALFAATAGIDTVEPFEDPLLVSLGNTRPRIRNRQPHPCVGGGRAHADRGAATVLDRVIDQVLHDVLETFARAEHREVTDVDVDLRARL